MNTKKAEKVAWRPEKTFVTDRIDEIKKEMEPLYQKALAGTATQVDADKYSRLTWELRELEG